MTQSNVFIGNGTGILGIGGAVGVVDIDENVSKVVVVGSSWQWNVVHGSSRLVS